MKSCRTSIAREMGYLNTPSREERQFNNPVSILGPAKGEIRTYHASGLLSKEEFMKQRDYANCLREEFRL